MSKPSQSSNLMKPWAWLAAVAAVCLVLASSTALYAINSTVRLGLPWWTGVVAPVLVYALVLPLSVPRIRLSGWIIGFVTLAVLHAILGLVTTWLYASVGLTSFGEALAPAFSSFAPALVLEMVGSLLMTLPFLGALAPRSAAPRIQVGTPPLPRAAASKKPMQEVSGAPEQSRHVPARPTEPPAAPATAVLAAAAPPMATVAPVVEEPPMAAPEQHVVHAAPLLGTNGSALDIAEPSREKPADFRQALAELFGDPVPETKEEAQAVPKPPTLEPTADETTAVPSAEAPPRTVRDASVTPPVEAPAAKATPAAPAPAAAAPAAPTPAAPAPAAAAPAAPTPAAPAPAAAAPAAPTPAAPAPAAAAPAAPTPAAPAPAAAAPAAPSPTTPAPAAPAPTAPTLTAPAPAAPTPVAPVPPAPAPAAPTLTAPAPAAPTPVAPVPPAPAPAAPTLTAPAPAAPTPVAPVPPAPAPAAPTLTAPAPAAPTPVAPVPPAPAPAAPTLTAPAPAAPTPVAPVPPAPAPAGEMVRISFDRVAGQLPPGAFRVPLAQVGARLLEADTLLVAQSLIVPQLGEGMVQVEWEAVAEQFPAAVFAVAPAEVKERIVNGRLLLPLDEIVRQLSPEVFGASMGGRPVAVPGIENFPAPFKPLGSEGRPPASAIVPEAAPTPARDLAHAPAAATPEIVAAPARAPVSPHEPVHSAEPLPRIESSPPAQPWGPRESLPPLESFAKAEPAPTVAFAQTDAPQAIEVPSEAEITENLGKWAPPTPEAMEMPRAEPEAVPVSAAVAPAHAELVLESASGAAMAAIAPPVEPAAEAMSEASTEAAIRIPFDRVMAQLPADQFRFPLEQVGARLREPQSLLVPQALIVPQLGEGAVHAAWEVVVGQFPVEAFAAAPGDVKSHIEEGRLLLPLDEIVRQLPPEVFGGAMARDPVHVPGIESFPAPFKPLGYQEPRRVAVPPVSVAPRPEPVMASEPVTAPPSPPPLVMSPDPASAPAAPGIAEPAIAAEPRPVPVAPLYEAQTFERPIAAEPPATPAPERRGHAAMVAALMSLLDTAALEEAQIGDFNIISVTTGGMQGGTVAAAAGRLSPLIARAGPRPIDQVTLRGLSGALVLTPVGSGWSSGTALAVGTRPGGGLARLEMLARRAARHEQESLSSRPRIGTAFPRLEVTPAPPAVTAAAEDLTIFGPLAAQSFREPASGAVVHCLVSPGTMATELAPFACELAQAMAQTAPAEALGVFHSAVLRSGSTRVEIRRLPSAAGLALILVVGGIDTGRPGLARRQVERTAARLSVA